MTVPGVWCGLAAHLGPSVWPQRNSTNWWGQRPLWDLDPDFQLFLTGNW